ncbi:MAG TPA: AmmeMemoRadiSam system protein A [Propionibacteriaceae bacterium]|nr:AmmeMemoRadiSam system protein A [Propionibacteriaceae bacterium]
MPELPPEAGPVLCGIARVAIADRLGVPLSSSRPDAPIDSPSPAATPDGPTPHPWLDAPGAAFVTLTQSGRLRGCIGSLVAHRPLRQDVAANAVNAAVHDPRFPPLPAEELVDTHLEVSVLSAPEPYPCTSREDAAAGLRPGVDGVILEFGVRRGTFLPQVWDSLPDADSFLEHLVRKAGLPPGWWDERVRLSRYTVTAFEET